MAYGENSSNRGREKYEKCVSQSSLCANALERIVDKMKGKPKFEKFLLCFLLKTLGRNHFMNYPALTWRWPCWSKFIMQHRYTGRGSYFSSPKDISFHLGYLGLGTSGVCDMDISLKSEQFGNSFHVQSVLEPNEDQGRVVVLEEGSPIKPRGKATPPLQLQIPTEYPETGPLTLSSRQSRMWLRGSHSPPPIGAHIMPPPHSVPLNT